MSDASYSTILALGTDKENIKCTIESYQDPLTSFWVGAKMTLDLPSVAFATLADAGGRCQPGQDIKYTIESYQGGINKLLSMC